MNLQNSLPCYEGGSCGGPLREGLIVHFPRHPPPSWRKRRVTQAQSGLNVQNLRCRWPDNFSRMFWKDKRWQRKKCNKERSNIKSGSVCIWLCSAMLLHRKSQQLQNCLYTQSLNICWRCEAFECLNSRIQQSRCKSCFWIKKFIVFSEILLSQWTLGSINHCELWVSKISNGSYNAVSLLQIK